MKTNYPAFFATFVLSVLLLYYNQSLSNDVYFEDYIDIGFVRTKMLSSEVGFGLQRTSSPAVNLYKTTNGGKNWF